MRVTNWAVAFAFERAPRVQSNEPFAASLTVSLYSFGSSAPEPGPQVQLFVVQLVGSVAVTASTAPSVHAVPALIENANATVALYQGSAPTRACDPPSAVSAFDCDACACCGPIATPELSGIASRAWSLNAALPPHAAARTHERASSLRIGRAPFPAGGLLVPASMPWTRSARPDGNRDRSAPDSAQFGQRTRAHLGADRSGGPTCRGRWCASPSDGRHRLLLSICEHRELRASAHPPTDGEQPRPRGSDRRICPLLAPRRAERVTRVFSVP